MLGGGQTIPPIEGRREGQQRGKIAFAGLKSIKCFSVQSQDSHRTVGIVFPLCMVSNTFLIPSGEGQDLHEVETSQKQTDPGNTTAEKW